MLSPRLQTLLGAKFDEIDESNLQSLVEQGATESDDIDFKEAQYQSGGKGPFEVAKDIAAFANEIGGLIIIGLRDEQGMAVELSPQKFTSEIEASMTQSLVGRAFPMIRDVDFRRVPSSLFPGRDYLLVAIPRSAAAPHGVLVLPFDQNPLCWPARAGATTRFLREGELASRYRDRFELARGQVDRLDRIHHEGASHPENIGIRALTMELALTPEMPMQHPTHRTVTHLRDHFNEADLGYALFGVEKNEARAKPKRRRLRVAAHTIRWELYVDGAAWMRVLIGAPTVGDRTISLDIRDLERKLLAMLESTAKYCLWTGAAGDCAISVRVTGDSTQKLLLIDGANHEILGESEAWSINLAELTWSLADLTTKSGAHRAGYLLASDLEQDLGLVAPLIDSGT